jgi:LysM repeat protein
MDSAPVWTQPNERKGKVVNSLLDPSNEFTPSPRFRSVRRFLDGRRQDMADMMAVVRTIVKRKRLKYLDKKQRDIFWNQVAPLATSVVVVFIAMGAYSWYKWPTWFPGSTTQTAAVVSNVSAVSAPTVPASIPVPPPAEDISETQQQAPTQQEELAETPAPPPSKPTKPVEGSPSEPPAVKAVAVSDACPKTYLVRKGDSLWKISLFFWGSGFLDTKIVEVNSTVSNPDLIFVGQRLMIPCVDEPTMDAAQKLQAKSERLIKKTPKKHQPSGSATAAKVSSRTDLPLAALSKTFAPATLSSPQVPISIDFVNLPDTSLAFSKAENVQEIADAEPCNCNTQ